MSKIDLRPLLDIIPASEVTRADWIAVGMALKEEGYPVSVWSEWSATDTNRYHPGECEKKWNGFNRSGTTGAAIVELAKKYGWTPGSSRYAGPAPVAPTPRKKESKKRDLDKLPPPLDTDRKVSADLSPQEQATAFLKNIFRPGERFDLVKRTKWQERKDKPGKWDPDPDRAGIHAMGDKIDLTCEKPEAGIWVRCNPVKFPLVSDGFAVKNEDIAAFRHVLVECDDWTIEKQIGVYRRLRLPLASITDSGGHSAHGLVKLNARDADDYRKKVNLLYDIMESFGIPLDPQNKNVSRMTRMPGCKRGDRDQKLLYLDTGLSSFEEWVDFIRDFDKANEATQEKEVSTSPPETVEDIPLPSDSDVPPMQEDKPGEDFHPPALEVINAADLEHMDVKPPEFIVEGLIPVGLTVLAGPIKYGKSWLSLQLCLANAEGKPFMTWQTHKCGVLYLAREDSNARMKDRIKKVRQGLPGWPPGFDFAIKSQSLDTGLITQLEEYLVSHPGTRLFIVDTLQKVRGAMKRGESSYAYDYREGGRLKEFADSHNVAVVVITHTRKMKDDDDWLNMISGTVGITGVADTIITMLREKREDPHTHFHFTGRDVEMDEAIIQFDANRHQWINLGNGDWFEEQRRKDAYENSPLVTTIKSLLARNQDGWSGTASEFLHHVLRITGMKSRIAPKALGKVLQGIADDLWINDGIQYDTKGSGTSGKRHCFYRVPVMEDLPDDTPVPFEQTSLDA